MADLFDVITLTEAKQELGIFVDADDTLLARYVTACSNVLDGVAGPIVQRTYTAELHDGGRTFVTLRNPPVVSVASVSDNGTAVTGTVLIAKTGVLRRDALGGLFAPVAQGVSVTYTAGRFDTTDNVAPLFKEATSITLQHWWRVNQGMRATSDAGDYTLPPGFVVPRMVITMLSAARELKGRPGMGMA